MKKTIFKILRICGYLVGFSLLLYPAVSHYMNQRHNTAIISDYKKKVSHISQKEEDTMIKKARVYNRTLGGNVDLLDPFGENKEENKNIAYEQLLKLDDSGMMGYINIPQINLTLPMYHGISEPVLQTGVGHLENTSLPVGGKSSHCVLSGHRGLPSAKLFTDLDQMKNGDVFYIKILHHTFAYKVDQILTVKPEKTEELQIVKGQDYVTLVTCTPYGINTHRILVRGKRIPYTEQGKAADKESRPSLPLYAKALIGAVIAVILIYVAVKCIMKRRHRWDNNTGEN